MRLKILAFGIAKNIVNGQCIEIETPKMIDAGSLKKILEGKYPQLKELRSFMIAVNDEYTDAKHPIAEGDEIAIIPPVSGG
jgi:molybdopterin converting factor subunit 1